MKCGNPVLCYLDSKGKRIFRNFEFLKSSIGGIPRDHMVLDCGKCLHCRKKRALELATRCVLHASLYKENCFLTLTYDEKKEGYHNEFEYSDIQKFKKRLRQYFARTLGARVEVFNVHEYGKNGKKHWHLIVFGGNFSDKVLYTTRNSIPYFISERLKKLWPQGHHTIGDVTEASAMYQSQYMEKDFKHYNSQSAKKSHSKHSGLGRPYFEKHYKQLLTLGYVPFNGKKIPLPRYFERLGHKHYCHFHDPKRFREYDNRKRLYTPFKDGEANVEISELYRAYIAQKQERIKVQAEEWDGVISQFLQTGEDPDFIKSLNNNLYDLRNKNAQENF